MEQSDVTIRRPKVSVMMITYNHERFVRQAVESVLAQQIEFDMELVIGEDCSTDGTGRIVAELAAEHPTTIRLLAHAPNVGMSANARYTLAACQGEYIAILEGDDYWSNPSKLQLQITFLEKNPEYALVCGRARVVLGSSGQIVPPEEIGYFSESETVERDWSPTEWSRVTPATSTLVIRRDVIDELNADRFRNEPVSDTVILFLAATHGRIRYMPRDFSVYRVHAGGCWSSGTADFRVNLSLTQISLLIRHKVYVDSQTKEWLQQLFDYNAILLATLLDDVALHWKTIEQFARNDVSKMSRNDWALRTACREIVSRNKAINDYRRSFSFRLGHGLVQVAHLLSLGYFRQERRRSPRDWPMAEESALRPAAVTTPPLP